MSHAMMTVGFVGLGDQGLPLAQAIGGNGFPLHVWARNQHSLTGLAETPHIVEPSLQSLGAVSDIVGLCLPEDRDAFDVVVNGGLLAAMRPGTVIVNHGTGVPAAARELANLTRKRDVEFADAPVSGGHAVALARRLLTIVGASIQTFALIRPALDTFSKSVIHLGPVGAGQVGKLVNNIVMMTNHASIKDAVDLARRLDIDLGGLIDVLRSGSASSTAIMAFGPSITGDNAAHLQHLEKLDIGLFADAVSDLDGAGKKLITRASEGADALVELTNLIVR
jgi:3-hydroxyisobutyrate dehydrogenase-like beta-hydroxyacid dehydrogenase